MRISIFLLCLSLSACSSTKQEMSKADKAVDPSKIRSQTEVLESSSKADWTELDPEYTLFLEVPDGRIVISLSKSLAQGHVKQIKTLAREGYFDGLTFYRVIEGFVAQAGSKEEERGKGSAQDSLMAEFDEAYSVYQEFTPLGNGDGYAEQVGFIDGQTVGRDLKSNKVWLTHCAGALAFARATSANSANGTIYITIQPQRYLDRNLTVVGRVVWGMEHVQSIQRAAESGGGIIESPEERTKIISMKVASDVPEDDREKIEIFNTNSPLFEELIESRRNRPEEFFYHRHNYIDLCQMPIPVREIGRG